jgi:O-antigen ligase
MFPSERAQPIPGFLPRRGTTTHERIARIQLGWLLAVIAAAFLTPSVKLIPGLPGMRVEEGLLFGWFWWWMAVRLAYGVQVPWTRWQKLFVWFPAFLLVSVLAGAAVGYRAALGDGMQLVRWGKYFLAYSMAVTTIMVSMDRERTLKTILHFKCVVTTILFLITLQQRYDLFGLNAYYMPYIASSQAQQLLYLDAARAPRTVGLVGNPNELGFLFCMALLTTVALIRWRGVRAVYVLVALAEILGVAFTISRTAFIASATGLVFLVPTYFQRSGSGRRGITQGLVIVAIVTTASWLVYRNFSTVALRFESMRDLNSDTSWQGRLEAWEENMAIFKENMIFGAGPLKRVRFEFDSDNDWLLMLRSYGIVGTLFLITVFVAPLFGARGPPSLRTIAFGRSWRGALLIAGAIYMIPAGLWSSLTLMPAFLVFYALGEAHLSPVVIQRPAAFLRRPLSQLPLSPDSGRTAR